MNEGKVFYSWQSDSSTKLNRNLIGKALETAISRVNASLHLLLAVDQDSRGEGGSPVIADAVRSKIARSLLFVGDLTIVAKRNTAGGLVNSNVGIEWGWAGALLGNECLIGVMNTASGGPELLPVDIHPQLVPVRYSVDAQADSAQTKTVRMELTGRLEEAITAAIRRRFFRSMHQDAPTAVGYLIRSAVDLRRVDEWSPESLAGAAQISEDSALAVLEDLNRAGLMTTEDAGHAGGPEFIVRTLPSLFVHFDSLYMGWNPDEDARLLARELVSRGRFISQPMMEELGWSPRRMNPALWRLDQAGFASASNIVDASSPLLYGGLKRNEYTRAFAEGRDHLPAIAMRAQFQMD